MELLRLERGAALATWVDAHVTWAQFIDTALGKPMGSPRSLGYLSGDEADARPHAVALPDGDVAFVGVLPNGRMSFARGSETPARRVAPKAVLAGEESSVQEFALAAHGAGVALILLRVSPYALTSVVVQLQLLGARGEPIGERREWQSPIAYSPQIADCGGTLFLAWETERGVIVTRVSTAGEGTLGALPFATQLFGSLPHVSPRLSSLTCEGSGARLLVGWHSSSGKAPARASISSALLSATASEKRGAWSSVQLPGPVLGRDGFAHVDAESGKAHVAIELDGKVQSVAVDLAAGKLVTAPEPRSLPSAAACLPSAADRFVCAEMQRKTLNRACHEEESTLVYSFPGFGTAAAATGAARREYFLGNVSGIAEPERAARHFCGDPGWSALQVALADWCRDPAGAKARFADADEEELGSFETYCGDTPDSQLYQVTHCTDQPPSCKPQPDRRLAVDRNGLESGSEELWLMGPDNCSVRFSGKPGAWRVAEAACQSSE